LPDYKPLIPPPLIHRGDDPIPENHVPDSPEAHAAWQKYYAECAERRDHGPAIRAAIDSGHIYRKGDRVFLKPPAVSKHYTVILLLPDHVADQYGETWMSHVSGVDPKAAIAEACSWCIAGKHLDDATDPEDFVVVAVFEGHHNDVKG
jgi:hypothetical protein